MLNKYIYLIIIFLVQFLMWQKVYEKWKNKISK